MKQTVVTVLLASLLLAPVGQGQWIQDAEGDTDERIAVVEADHGRSGASDIHSVDVEETEDDLFIALLHASAPSPQAPIMDSAYFDMTFLHGDIRYRVSVDRNVPLTGEVAYFADLWEEDRFFTRLAELEVEETDGGFRVTVPKGLIPDQNGAYPTQGTQITEFLVRSSTQSFGNICIDAEGCITMGPRATDRAPDEGPGKSYDFQHGIPQDGAIRLFSSAPVRWSNGEATVFVFEVMAANGGTEKDVLTFIPSDVPDNWDVAFIGAVELQPGEQRAIPVPVRVPFAHAHGSDPRFLLEAFGQSGTGRIELGVHYPAIPQPTGHHSQVFIHSREQQVFVFEELLYNALGGGLGTVAYMNTADQHDGDESVPVKGNKNGLAGFEAIDQGEAPTDYGVVYEWAVPLSPGLRTGLQTHGNVTEGTLQFSFDVTAGDVDVYGRIAAVSTEELETFGFNSDFDVGQTIATIEAVDRHSVSSSVSVPVTIQAEPMTVPFDPDQELVAYIAAHVIRPDVILTPNTGVYLTEGDMVLPLNEYHDAVPVNVSFPQEVQQQAIQSLDAPEEDEAKEATSIGAIALLGVIAIAMAVRRGRT